MRQTKKKNAIHLKSTKPIKTHKKCDSRASKTVHLVFFDSG